MKVKYNLNGHYQLYDYLQIFTLPSAAPVTQITPSVSIFDKSFPTSRQVSRDEP
jgi:hypothetical protein